MKKLITIIIGSLLLPIIAFAQTTDPTPTPTGDFTIYPTYKHGDNQAWIVNTVNPGDTYTDYLTLQNLTTQQQIITLKVHEAEQKETFVIKETDKYENLGNWIVLEDETHTLYPGETKKIPVHILIPKNVHPKEYIGTILASQTKTSDQNLNIVTRIGVRVYLNITAKDLQVSTLGMNAQLTPILLILSIIGLIGAISLNIISCKKNK